ncbi:VOC family protein [Runella aurantiaca]|uniref:VOC domain-containing protein n=1 Tax=Runella aurantiaca TaxID=2282308 RepID=A0A369IBD9_9BACT|nr:VOC family protein [Runella aurantiaca]RDB05595.1 hypothetical protein DVG78_13520 [Runella aurantiaca]
MIIKELTLLSDNLAETKQFYTRILGLRIVGEETSTLSFSAGATLLCFEQSTNLRPRYHFAFNIPYTAVMNAFSQMSKKVDLLPISENSKLADFVNWNAKSFYFYDNNGNILEFIGRNDLPDGDKMDSSFILSVSEIGLPVENVKDECEKLINKHRLEYFAKQPPSDTFSVIGEDTGLLIIVPDGRNWYPTGNHPAEAFKIKLVMLNAEREVTLLYE